MGSSFWRYEYISQNNPHLDPDQKQHLRFEALHGLGDRRQHRPPVRDEPAAPRHRIAEDADSPIRVDDALTGDPGDRFDMVLTNPPFGKKSSMTVVNAEGEAEREDLMIAPGRLLGHRPRTSNSTSSSTSRHC